MIFAFTFFAFIIPFILKFLFYNKLTSFEIIGSIFVSIIASLICLGFIFKNIYNLELLHGYVIDKKQNSVSCSHSYKCGCIEITNSDGSVSESCSVCYEHRYDFDWDVFTTLGHFTIDRIDPQGIHEPKRFSSIKIGDSVSKENLYIDYLSSASYSLLNFEKNINELESMNYSIPSYPKIFDYYNTNLVLNSHHVNNKILNEINFLLRKSLNIIASKKQVNILVVFTKYDQKFGNYLQYKWNNGRKNDQIIVIGLNNDSNSIDWVYSFGWSSNQMVNISIRNELKDFGSISNTDSFVEIIVNNVDKYFSRTPMAEYEYLLYDIQVPYWVFLISIFIQLSFNVSYLYFSINNKNFVYGKRF